MEITPFLRETYRNLPRANKPIGNRFLEPRVSQMWGIGGSEGRPPTRSSGLTQVEHGQNLLSASGSSGVTSSAVTTTGGRRWSAVQNAVQNATPGQGNTSTTLGITSHSSTSSSLAHQQSVVMSPTDGSVVPTSGALLARGNSPGTTVSTGTVSNVETRRISFVIQDDIESISSSQTTLAVQVFIFVKH